MVAILSNKTKETKPIVVNHVTVSFNTLREIIIYDIITDNESTDQFVQLFVGNDPAMSELEHGGTVIALYGNFLPILTYIQAMSGDTGDGMCSGWHTCKLICMTYRTCQLLF